MKLNREFAQAAKASVCLLAGLALLSGTVFGARIPRQSPREASPPAGTLLTGATLETITAALERDIPRLMAEADVPGLSIALIRNGEFVWNRGFGLKNSTTREPVTADTVFEAASLSKPVFAYAVMKLVDNGQFDLDKPLNQYLPGDYDVGPDPRLGQITARRVLSHTSGFPNWRGKDQKLKIYFTPGERFSYSGEGYVYLSKVIEHVTQEKFNDFMKRTVFGPLGMTSSSYVWEKSYDTLKVTPHNSIGLPTEQRKPIEPNAAASLHTTARDYARFVVAILNGTGLKAETMRQMLTPQVKVGAGFNTLNKPADKLMQDLSWGLGWGLQTTGDGLSFWHWGDNGDCKAFVEAFERQKIGLVMFANGANGLSFISDLVSDTLGGRQPALAWINYESYKSPARMLLKRVIAMGAKVALRDYCETRKGRPPGEVLSEAQMNRVGYDLLYGVKRVEDAIEVFKLNVEDYPNSANVYDSLGEAYMVDGDGEMAIRNYEQSLRLDPKNTNAAEALKKLRSQKNISNRL